MASFQAAKVAPLQTAINTLASGRQIRMAITVIYRAKGKCSVEDVYNFVASMPATMEQVGSAGFRQSYCGQCLMEAAMKSTPDVELAGEYVLKEWPRLGDRTQ